MKFKLFFLTYLFQFIALSALAYDAEIDGIYYNLNQTDQTAQVTFFENNKPVYSGDIILPESVPYDGVTYKVTSIGKQAFDNCSELRSMVIPNSVTSIEEFAFFNCNLRCLTIGSGVKEINYRAFVCQITKVIWLTNTPPSGYNNVKGLVHYVPNEQFTAFNNKKVYSLLSSLFEVDGMKYIPVSLSERTCDVIDCIDDELHNEVNINPIVSYKGIDMKVLCVQPYTFYQNSNLQKVNINVAGSIGQHMFDGCKNLQRASLGKDVTAIEEYAFNDCSNLESIVVPDSVKEIGQYAFSDCPTMTSAIIGIGTQTIGQYAFSNCRGLTSVSIGNGTRDIGQYAFSGCSGLTSIIIGNSTKTIRQYAFQNCSSLPVITIPSSLYSIRDYAFSGCISLKEIDLVDRYEDKATITYDDLSVSKSSSINSSTTFEVSEGDVLSFHYSLSNVALHVNFGNEVIGYSKNSGDFSYYFDKSGTVRIWLEAFWQNNSYGGNVTNIKVENDGILVLGSNGNDPLFASCPLDSVYIGRNTTYSKSPFYANKSLRSVEISDRDKAISANEFYGCTNLQNVEIGNGVKSIGDWAFSGCSALDLFAFGTSVESIGKEAFSDCTSLTRLISRAATPPTCGAQALDDINKWTCKLIVPQGYLAPYQAADQWKDFFFIEEGDPLPVPVTGIMIYANNAIAAGNSEALTITFTPENTTEKDVIWSSSDETVAEVDNNGVVTGKKEGSVTITAKSLYDPEITASCIVTILPPNIIFADSWAKSICVENWDTNGDGELNEKEAAAVTDLGSAFRNWGIRSFDELKYFTGLTFIRDRAFYSKRDLTSITIPENVQSIGEEAFAYCESLSSIKIGKSVASIGKNVFTGCDSLKTISIESENKTYDSRDNCNAIIETATNTLLLGCMGSSIPNGVVIIDERAFYNCKGLQTIDIPSSVTTLGTYAFSGCTSLTNITISEGITNIGKGAFNRCSSLTSIDIPEGVTSISSLAFDGCTSLVSITFPSTLTLIDWEYWDSSIPTGFAYCDNLKEIHIKDLSAWCKIKFKTYPLAKAHHLFLNGEEVTDLIIPDDVSSISAGAFAYCYGLNSVVIPEGVKGIGSSAFAGCDNLRIITINGSSTEIESYAFNSNSQKMVYYPDLTTWCKSSFGSSFNNYRLFINGIEIKELIIPEDVTEIGKNAFAGYTGLTSVKFSNSVKTISDYAFRNCTQLTSVTFSESITDIGVGAFQGCSNLYSIALPDGVVTLPDEVFRDCSNLTSVILSDGLTNIGAMAFYNCYRLSSLTLSKTLESIGQNAFYRCSQLSSFTIPKSLTNISSDIFYGCSSLSSIKVEEGNPVYDSRGDCNAIIETETNTLILGCKNTIIPMDILHIGYGAFSQCSGLSTITIPDGVQSIDGAAFSSCSGLTSITIPNSVKSIGNGAFYNCYSASIIIPDSLAFVGSLAFDGTAWLNNQPDGLVYAGLVAYKYKGTMPENTSIDIKEGTTCICGGLFGSQNNLTSINLPKSVAYIGEGAFYGCIGLTSVNLPESVSFIGNSAFSGCRNLTSINLPDGISFIDVGAFSNCTNLTAIIIPKGLNFIEQSTFMLCSNLESIIFPQNLDSIAGYAIWGCNNLKSVTSLNPTPPIVEDGNYFPYTTATLYVPAGSKEAYQAANVWKEFINIEELEPTGIIVHPKSIESQTTIAAIYDANGRKLSKMQRGVNILLMNDGTKRKVIMK